MEPFTEIHEAITSNVPEILRQFDSLTEEEPWAMLPREYRTDELASCSPGQRTCRWRLPTTRTSACGCCNRGRSTASSG